MLSKGKKIKNMEQDTTNKTQNYILKREHHRIHTKFMNNNFFLWWPGFEPHTLHILDLSKHAPLIIIII